jgi:hypothetical protein
MNNFNFGEVLTRAWKIIWKHKVLWIFGILASCARGNGGGGNSGGNSNYSGSGEDFPFGGGQAERYFEQAGRYFEDNLWIIFVAILVIFLISIVAFALGMIGRAGMIKGTAMADKDAESLAFGEIWSESLPYFWRLFGLNFLIRLAIFAVIFIPIILLAALAVGVAGPIAASAGLFLCFIPILCLLVPISWVVTVVLEQAQAAIVLEDLSMMDGLKRGWAIVKSNPGPMVIMALILGIGGAIVGVVVSMPLVLAVLPVVIGMNALRESMTPVWIALGCCVAYLPVLLLLNGVLTAYIQSAWALTYMRLSQPAQPKDDAPIIIEANA